MINSLVVSGLIPLTTIDFPDHLAAVIFCQGCPFKCYYCHNPGFIDRSVKGKYSWQQIEDFLLKRIGLLEAVVFSGGEPTLQLGLVEAVKIVKQLGFKIGLHTAGPYPNKLAKVLPYLDWVGMDIKAPFESYESITAIPNSGKMALASARLILASKIAYEFRTTVHPKLLNSSQLLSLKKTLDDMGGSVYKIQEFRKEGCINPDL